MIARNTAGTVSDSFLNQYTVHSHQYPVDLDTSPEYGGNKVVFFINVAGEGKIASTAGAHAMIDVPRDRLGQANSNERLSQTGAADAVRGAATSVGQAVGAVPQGEQAKIAMPMRRLTHAISLYIPNELSTSWNADYGEVDMANLDMVARGLDILTGPNNANDASMIDRLREGAALVGSAIGKAAFEGSEFRQMALRTTPGQSKMEQLFNRVNFRDFSFFFMFAPKNEREAGNVLNIIRTFRHHMLPEFRDANQFLYLFPSEFDVRYYRGDSENDNLEKQFTAVLTNMSINYSPMGIFNTFPNGMPTQINMQLSFRELNVATKETSPYNAVGA